MQFTIVSLFLRFVKSFFEKSSYFFIFFALGGQNHQKRRIKALDPHKKEVPVLVRRMGCNGEAFML